MMEIRCSETNRMGQELPCGLKSEACVGPAPARSSESGRVQLPERCIVRGKRKAVRPREVWWESVKVKFERCIVRASRDFGARIRFNLLFASSIGPKKAKSVAKWENYNLCTRIKRPQRRSADQL